MFRVLRLARYHSLDKNSMLHRRSCFYPQPSDKQKGYSQNTIKYAYNLGLHPGKNYQGTATIDFTLQKKQSIFLDFNSKQVHQIVINHHQINPKQLHNPSEGRINLPAKYLKQGINSVCVRYENEYDKDGSGCVSFTDVDGKQYLYTQFQPYMGNRVFPMFDQPDLKAKMDLAIACPRQWETVLSNQHERNTQNFLSTPSVCNLTKRILNRFKQQLPKNYKVTAFNTTKLLPTYLFCFVVGPYKKYFCSNTYRNIPMNLYCIESLYPYMTKLAPFIEQMTNKSMQFFEQYFGYPYPFNKYDQVFAHEYKWGAMENAGIVTLNDLYIFKDPVSVQKMLGFGNTIVHQMAHHWFGNLVTMKWWDDLWLNQSFAQYISHFCLQKIKPSLKTISFQSAMTSFLARKGWGYADDQLSTTHPIRSQVANTQVAQSIFDGITYSKGAATMKQLMYLMGEDQFSKALKQYFHAYQFGNAELEDLLKFMKKYYNESNGNISIDQWKVMWLERAGLNVLSGQLDQKKLVYKITQSAYDKNHPTLRSHTLKLAILSSANQIQQLQIQVQPKQTTIIQLTPILYEKIKNSKATLLNYQDLSFCKVLLDNKSIKFFKQHLNEVKDVLLRAMVWKNFSDMAKDANLSSKQYINILQAQLFRQSSDVILEENLAAAALIIQKYTPRELRGRLYGIMQECCQNYLISTSKSQPSNRSIIARSSLITFSDPQNSQHMALIQSWYAQKQSCPFTPPNITQSWRILIKLLSSKHISKEKKKQLLKSMIEKDKSDTAKNKVLTCEGLIMDSKDKVQKEFKRLIEQGGLGMTAFIHSIAGINNRIHQPHLRQILQPQYFTLLKSALHPESSTTLPKSLSSPQQIELFLQHMDPNTDDNVGDLQQKIKEFEAILKMGIKNNDKIEILIRKKIDMLGKRKKSYIINKGS